MIDNKNSKNILGQIKNNFKDKFYTINMNIIEKLKLEQMFQSGMHLGHLTREWNPRMAPFIYTKRNGYHVLDLVQTNEYLEKVLAFLEKSASQGKTFFFVGTKKQIAPLIAKTALNCNSYYINQRWLGGMFTNWQTIKKSLKKLQEYQQAITLNEWSLLKKQEISRKKREKDRLYKYLAGIENMSRLPDIVIIVGQPEEIHAVQECRQLGIPTVTILDSNCDPTLSDWFVPSNDDSFAAVNLLLNVFEKAILHGQTYYHEHQLKQTNIQKEKSLVKRKIILTLPQSEPLLKSPSTSFRLTPRSPKNKHLIREKIREKTKNYAKKIINRRKKIIR